LPLQGHMQDDILRCPMPRLAKRDPAAVRTLHMASVARLTARSRVKARPVEFEAAIRVDASHDGLRSRQAEVVAEESMGGHWRAQTASKGAVIPCRRVSHCGTGSPFERRKSGLKSFDW